MKNLIKKMIVGLALTASPHVFAQDIVIDVHVDLESLVCALLPGELPELCAQDLRYGETSAEALKVCDGQMFSDDKRECRQIIRGKFFSREALKVCEGIVFGDAKNKCVATVANGYYQPGASSVCSSLVFADEATGCMGAIKDRSYSPAELNSCRQEFFGDNRIECLQDLGYPVNWRSNYRRGSVHPAPRRSVPTVQQCTVSNSSSVLGTIAASEFLTYARNFAAQERSCVVSNIKGQTRSRTFIDASGRVRGQGLTEAEASEMRRDYNYSRCRILTCDL